MSEQKGPPFEAHAVRPFTPPAASGSTLFTAFCALVLFNAVDAWDIGPVPIQWLVRIGIIGVALWQMLEGRLFFAPGSAWLLAFLSWGIFVTASVTIVNNPSTQMPAAATTSYSVYVLLRFVNLFAFLGMLQLVYTLCHAGHTIAVRRWMVFAGAVVAVFSLYVYFAQTLGLPFPARTRLDTNASMDHVTTFSGAVHRAIGPFREPSMLAEWLILPLFLSFIEKKPWSQLAAVLIMASILLTASLTGIFGAVVGLGIGILVTNPFRREKLKLVAQIAVVFLLSLILFQTFVVSNFAEQISLFGLLFERISPILQGGVLESNRSYVWEYVSKVPIPFLGDGFGNPNLAFARYLGADLPASFLSVYFNTAYSTGWIGLVLIGGFLLSPLRRLWVTVIHPADDRELFLLTTAYCGWLVMYAVHSEELSPLFAVAFALLASIPSRREAECAFASTRLDSRAS